MVSVLDVIHNGTACGDAASCCHECSNLLLLLLHCWLVDRKGMWPVNVQLSPVFFKGCSPVWTNSTQLSSVNQFHMQTSIGSNVCSFACVAEPLKTPEPAAEISCFIVKRHGVATTDSGYSEC